MLQKIYKIGIQKIHFWLFIFAMLFSAMLVAGCHVFNLPQDPSTIATVYVTDFHWVDLILWACIVVIVYLLLQGICFLFSAVGTVFFQEERSASQGKWVFIGSFVLLMIFWIPYLMSYRPGGIYSDTVDSIHMALYKDSLSNYHPILYTLIWRLMFRVTGAFSGKGEYGGLNLFTEIQTILMALALAYFVYRCYRWGLHKAFVFLCLLVFAVFPLYPFYGISLWKDTFFSLAVFIFSVFLYHVFSKEREDLSPAQLALYSLLSLLIVFLRNNGIYVAAFYGVTITLLCLLPLRKKKIAIKVGTASLVILVFSAIIQGPVYDRLGYNLNKSTESFGIPLQQTAYILSTDGKVSEEDLEVIGNILPPERWRELYNPIVADTIKFDPDFNRSYMETHAKDFMKTYFHLAAQNPVKAVKAYMLATMGFWDVFESSSTAYICNFHFGNVEYFMSDYFDYYLDISFRNLVEPKNYISSALFAWLMLETIFICLAKRNYKGIIALMPTFGVWLSIMAAAPVAFSFRYVYALFLCVPLYLIICIHSFKNTHS